MAGRFGARRRLAEKPHPREFDGSTAANPPAPARALAVVGGRVVGGAFHKSFLRFVNEYRVEEARCLLRELDLNFAKPSLACARAA